MANQTGSIYLRNATWFLKYRTSELLDGTLQRVHKSERLCTENGQEHHRLCEEKGEHRHRTKTANGKQKIVAPKNLDGVRQRIMKEVNAKQPHTGRIRQDMRIVTFWEEHYLPYCEREWKGTGMKASTVRGFKQIWGQHLEPHFGELTLQQYTTDIARRFLQSLKTKQGKNTLKHIRALASAMFNEAIERELRTEANPWHLKLPKDCKSPESTDHYTLAEAEDMVSALVDHVDCQLIIALSCFLGLRPSEIAALCWEDFDSEYVHIRRSVVRGIVGTPKTPEAMAPVPLINQVRIPLELWRNKCGKPEKGWVFESRRGTPIDLHNFISRIIIPHVNGSDRCAACDRVPKASGVTWKGLYSGRRGACTAAIEATHGNYAVAQALLRHKSMTTTLNVYKKAITPEAFKAGMKLLEAAGSK